MARRHAQLVAIGQRIREARSAAGVSQEALANLLDLDRAYVGRIERGEANVGLLNFLLIASRLEVEPDRLLPSLKQISSLTKSEGHSKSKK